MKDAAPSPVYYLHIVEEEAEEENPVPEPLYYSMEPEDDEDYLFAGIEKEVYGAYKCVDRKVKPVPGVFPEGARVHCAFPEDPLASLPLLTPHLPDFTPGMQLTQEQMEEMNIKPDGFLRPEEEKLFKHILRLNEAALAFEDTDRGMFREDYFSPYIIPIVLHKLWEFSNIPIPPGIKEKVIKLLKEKMAARVYEASQSLYRS
ncbi:hypothetical protein SCP_0206900 [Sparassis crispa]|uniref:Uncharacterized protein n=1 Tax=Sparassis crispa TaxID=139825 RepID=A0A401GBD6_9APHY|nr:hypothetical protein SCP_0206900 [Sparassis crispa]GBE79490.1 hypothetical protein SCP_0206900 [Sparassis crispa]